MRLILIIYFLLNPVFTTTALSDWSLGDQADIDSVESFFNTLDTFRAQFVQTSPDGHYTEGWIWLQRPHYLRVEYAPPTNLLLVATGTFLIFFDQDIDQVSTFTYDVGPFRFLLKDKVDLTADMIVNTIDRKTGLLRLTLVDEDDPTSGSVAVSFAEDPMILVGWTVTDSEGLKTEITLHGPSFGLDLPTRLFRFTDQDRVRRNYRYGEYE
tara:strand:- start:330 stop:962 length:633 start_codon:yes stop_codon:yes gene_type:complete